MDSVTLCTRENGTPSKDCGSAEDEDDDKEEEEDVRAMEEDDKEREGTEVAAYIMETNNGWNETHSCAWGEHKALHSF